MAMTSELPLTKTIQATNFYSKIWGRILILRRPLLGPVPYFYNHWWFSLLGTDHSPSGTKQCNEVWIVVYTYIYFLAYILWFFLKIVSSLFPFEWWGLSIFFVTTLTLIYGRFIHCKNEPWSKVKIILSNLKAKIRMWPLCFLYWPRSGIWAHAQLSERYIPSNCGKQDSGSITFSSTN